jgi:hypothetical protein
MVMRFICCRSDLNYVRFCVQFFIIITFFLILIKLYSFIINLVNFASKFIKVYKYFSLDMKLNLINFFSQSFLIIKNYNIFLKFVKDFSKQSMFLK